ncbi:hypothetical protein ACFL5I_01965, partial [Planctomycetota bacterium]
MSDLWVIIKTRLVLALNQVKSLATQSKLKTGVITFAAIGFWLSAFRFFLGGFVFLEGFPDLVDWLIGYLFALFFFALTLMLIISNTLISYISLYKSNETGFLLTTPVRIGNIFLYNLGGSLVFSSWSFLFLGTPLMFAYAVNRGLPLFFYPLVVILMCLFIFIPAGLGSLLALVIATFFPRTKKQLVIFSLGLVVVIALISIIKLSALRHIATPFTERWMYEVFNRLTFCQNPLFPSHWITQAIMASARSNYSDIVFYSLMLLANALFISLLGYYLAQFWYRQSYSQVHSSRAMKKYRSSTWIDRVSSVLLGFLKPTLRLIMVKDLKTFSRDPIQWSQFIIFFGLLGIYFVNLRNIPYINVKQPFWQSLVSFLNLTSTMLTLAIFTTRFIYPQISLEGKRFWIMGVLPIKRSTIIYSKFLFAFLGALLVSESLVFISSWMLKLPIKMLWLQLYMVLIISLGLSALAVGLGALYPNLKEDNPSKIVSGFGGTLNLVLSLLLVLSVIALEAMPYHFHFGMNKLSSSSFNHWLWLSTGLIT